MTEPQGAPAADPSPPALEIRGVRKRYGDVVALDGVSLRVDGGVFGLLGANGAGKSTLFRALLDLLPLDAGRLEIFGLDVRTAGVAARRLIGYLPEELELYDRLTGAELLDLIGGLKGVDPTAARTELDFFGLTDAADRKISGYSMGMRRRLGLSAAFLGGPRLVLLDEPLNGLDTESMRRLRNRIAREASEGRTFVVSSHVMSFVERVCDRMAVLRCGRVVADGTADDLRRTAGAGPGEPFEDVFLTLAVDSPC